MNETFVRKISYYKGQINNCAKLNIQRYGYLFIRDKSNCKIKQLATKVYVFVTYCFFKVLTNESLKKVYNVKYMLEPHNNIITGIRSLVASTGFAKGQANSCF